MPPIHNSYAFWSPLMHGRTLCFNLFVEAKVLSSITSKYPIFAPIALLVLLEGQYCSYFSNPNTWKINPYVMHVDGYFSFEACTPPLWGRGIVLESPRQHLKQRYGHQDLIILRTQEDIMRRHERFRLAYHMASQRMILWLVRAYTLRRLHLLSIKPCYRGKAKRCVED